MRSPFTGRLYVTPDTAAARDAELLRRIATRPHAVWVGEWTDAPTVIDRTLKAAAGRMVTFVVYAIPGRDNGGQSAGGLRAADDYATWVTGVAAAIKGRPCAVILEPDALPWLDTLPADGQTERLALLSAAVRVLARARAAVYIDAGHSHWQPADVMVGWLRAAGVEGARGFALNVSNFFPTAGEVVYGQTIATALGRHFVVDTSRNGVDTGYNGWCNPPGKGLGRPPTGRTGVKWCDAYLWVKRPGESDGECNGGPRSGSWWVEYALGLASRATS
jgi:endoglucanase